MYNMSWFGLLSDEDREFMRLHTQYLQPEYVLRFPFAVIDAALHHHLRRQSHLRLADPEFKRIHLNDGTACYMLQSSELIHGVDVAMMEIRAVASEKTYITCTPEPMFTGTTKEERDYSEGWCKYALILFILGFWSDQQHITTLDAITPTPENTHLRRDQETLKETRIIITPHEPQVAQPDFATPETDSIPPIPDPTEGLEQVLNWFDRYSSTQGLNIDQVARRVGLAPKTLYNARHASGRTRKKGIGKNKGKTKEIEGNSAS